MFTLGVHADRAHVLVDPALVGAELVASDRGGDVTYHGPGQLVAYPIVNVPTAPRSIPCHVHGIEQVVIDTLADLGVRAGRLAGYPGVWVDAEGPAPRKICAIGVRVTRGRSMHGLALNVDPGMEWFERIVPCGIGDKAVTSLAAEGVDVPMKEVVDLLVGHAVRRWAPDGLFERQDVAWPTDPPYQPPAPLRALDHAVSTHPGEAPAPAPLAGRVPGERLRIRLRQAGVGPGDGLPTSARKPPWLRVPARMGDEFLGLRRTVRDLGLVTVCEEAGCPNIFECWADGTATFMINGERCTRSCGFCLVDTRHPVPPDPEEPDRVAAAVERLDLAYAVVTAVARDDLRDGGAAGYAATIRAIRHRRPTTAVEVLIPDCKGDPRSLDTHLRGAARRPQSQPRDGGAPAARRSALGRLRAQSRRSGPGQGRWSRDEVGDDPRDGGAPRRGGRVPSPISGPSAWTSSRSASTCDPRPRTSRWRGGGHPRSSSPCAPRARPWGSPTSSRRR